MSKKDIIRVYTDGACEGNPGPGGWAFVAVVPWQDELITSAGGEECTTSNRMELMAVLKCLEYFDGQKRVVIHTDSKYVENCINEWIDKWISQNWVKSDGEEVMNVDLLMEIADLRKKFPNVAAYWVKGHSGDKLNEMADSLAKNQIQFFRPSFLF